MQQTITSRDIDGNEYSVTASELNWRPATYGIVFHANKILLVCENNSYHLPGGGVDLGEVLEDAVIREVKEETGIQAANPRLLKAVTTFFSWQDMETKTPRHVQSILLYYACEFVGGQLAAEGLDAYEKARGQAPEWVDIEALDELTIGSTVDWRPIVKDALEAAYTTQ